MKAGLVCPSSPDVPPGIARAVQLIPARDQNWLICARRNASPGSQSAANIRQGWSVPHLVCRAPAGARLWHSVTGPGSLRWVSA